MSIADIRSGLGTNLATIRGLRVAETIPDNPNPPIAIIALGNVVYDGAFHGGLVTYNFTYPYPPPNPSIIPIPKPLSNLFPIHPISCPIHSNSFTLSLS